MEIFHVFEEVQRYLKSCIEENFFGFRVNQALKNLALHSQEAFKKNALEVYNCSLQYLEK